MILNLVGRLSDNSKNISIGLLGALLAITASLEHGYILMATLAVSLLVISIYVLRLRVVDLIIITLPVSFYIQLGTHYNGSLADFLLPVLFLTVLAKEYRIEFKEKSFGKSYILRYSFCLVLVVIVSIVIPILNNTTISGGLPNIFKFIVNMIYLYLFYGLFKHDLHKNNFRILKIWSYTSVLISIISIFGVLLYSKGIDIGITYSFRAKGTFEDPNLFGAYLILSLGITLIYNNLYKKRTIGINVMLIFIALLFTFSRGGIIAIFIGALLVFLLKFKLKKVMKLMIAGIILLSVFYPIGRYYFAQDYTNFFFTAFQRVTSGGLNDGSAALRVYLWDTAFELWKKSPIIGVGTGQYITSAYLKLSKVVPNIPHNTYLTFLAETGTMGFLTFMSLPLFGFWKVFSSAKRGNKLSAYLLISLISISVQAFTINLENFRIFWVFLAFCIVWVETKIPASIEEI